MTEKVFVTFNVWDNGTLTKEEVRDVAFDHFMDMQETFELNIDSSLRQIDMHTQTSNSTGKMKKERVYRFEIRVPAIKRSH